MRRSSNLLDWHKPVREKIHGWGWLLVGFGIFVLGVVGFRFFYPGDRAENAGGVVRELLGLSSAADAQRTFFVFIGLVALAAAFASSLYSKRPKASLWVLVLPALAVIGGIVCYLAYHKNDAESGSEPLSLWPFVIGLAIFGYLWWLAAVTFDLIFVWHRYICENLMMRWLRSSLGTPTERERTVAGRSAK